MVFKVFSLFLFIYYFLFMYYFLIFYLLFYLIQEHIYIYIYMHGRINHVSQAFNELCTLIGLELDSIGLDSIA